MKLLYFDCFNGASGDMILGALLDAGLPLEELRRALGSLGIAEYELAAERVLRAGVSATKFHLIERDGADRQSRQAAAAGASHAVAESYRSPSHAPDSHAGHTHAASGSHGGHRHGASEAQARHTHSEGSSAAARSRPSASQPGGDPVAHRALGAATGRPDAGARAVRAPGGSRGRHSPDAGRTGAPARGRRARLNHRHRRRGVRDRVVRRRPCRRIPAERRGRHGALGARRLPGAGARDGAPARRCAHLLDRGSSRAPDADRRAAADRARERVRPRSADARGSRRIRRRRPRACRHTQRAARARRGEHRGADDGAHRRARVRDRRHEPADLRRADGRALRRRCARGVLLGGADEEEPARARS